MQALNRSCVSGGRRKGGMSLKQARTEKTGTCLVMSSENGFFPELVEYLPHHAILDPDSTDDEGSKSEGTDRAT